MKRFMMAAIAASALAGAWQGPAAAQNYGDRPGYDADRAFPFQPDQGWNGGKRRQREEERGFGQDERGRDHRGAFSGPDRDGRDRRFGEDKDRLYRGRPEWSARHGRDENRLVRPREEPEQYGMGRSYQRRGTDRNEDDDD